MGIMALRQGLPVCCVGTAIYSMPGLAADVGEMALDDFWKNPLKPDEAALKDLARVLMAHVLVNGNFYTREGIDVAIYGAIKNNGSKGPQRARGILRRLGVRS